jgi:hypothetical protein
MFHKCYLQEVARGNGIVDVKKKVEMFAWIIWQGVVVYDKSERGQRGIQVSNHKDASLLLLKRGTLWRIN